MQPLSNWQATREWNEGPSPVLESVLTKNHCNSNTRNSKTGGGFEVDKSLKLLRYL